MSIAIFKPFILAAQEGERVWEKLVQKVVEKHEVDAHVADGWHTDAATALEAANAAEVEQENAALQAQIDATKAKLDGRKAKKQAADGADALRTDGPTVAEYVAAGYQAVNYPPQGYASRSTAEEIAAAVKAQAEAAPPAA
ncbi:hypothetical protein H3V53_06265 [Paraburkholderia bengalensis]|uniref:Uncharacterized protein n=1 Tax=Paraburkholderia bengalensis TaxID=2747562 RepID=A0ABU8IN13_9BURK